MNDSTFFDLITILGPTASGKTNLATALAYKLDGEIISADSRQVYRGMDIGTGKDLSEYTIDGKRIPYHLIDIVDAGTRFNLYEYQKAFAEAFQTIRSHNKQAIVCGGSGLYIEAAVEGYDLRPVPANEDLRSSLEQYSLEQLTTMLAEMKPLHNTTDVDTKKRAIRALEIEIYYKNHPEEKSNFPKFSNIYFGIDISRDIRRERISQRLRSRLDEGLIDEVKVLMQNGVDTDTLEYYGLEYKFISNYLTGKTSYEQMVSMLEIAIHQFAKRQMTWFRGMERKGAKINWIDGTLPIDEKVEQIIETVHAISRQNA